MQLLRRYVRPSPFRFWTEPLLISSPSSSAHWLAASCAAQRPNVVALLERQHHGASLLNPSHGVRACSYGFAIDSLACVQPPPPTPRLRRALVEGRSEQGALKTEPTPGQDTVYDGAPDMLSIAYNFGPRKGRWSTAQAYSSAFHSKVPRPYEAPMRREQKLCPAYGVSGGPLHYNPWGDHAMSDGSHVLSGSIIWFSRGRTGPTGVPYPHGGMRSARDRQTPPFQSQVSRYHFQAKAPPGRTTNGAATSTTDDNFVLKSEYAILPRLELQNLAPEPESRL